MTNQIKLFEQQKVRTHWDKKAEKWYFCVSDVISILTESIDPLAYWRKLKERLKKEGNETVTNLHGLTDQAKGSNQNAIAGKKGGLIAKDARITLEQNTGKKVVTGENVLPPVREKKKLDK